MKVTSVVSKPNVTIELTGDEAQHLFSTLNWIGVLSSGSDPRITKESHRVSSEIWDELHKLGFSVHRP